MGGSGNAGEDVESVRRAAGSCVAGLSGRTGQGCCVWRCRAIVCQLGSRHRLLVIRRRLATVLVGGAEADCSPCLLFAILGLGAHRF